MHKGKKKGTIFFALGILLMGAALALTLYNKWDGDRADRAAQEIVGKLEDRITEYMDSSEKEELLQDAWGMPTIEIDGESYIGVLEIPSLDLHLPVMEKWDYEKLKIAVCHYYGSYYTNDLVIAGHNYARHFSPIKWIDLEADVYFTNVEGKVYHYVVDHIETLRPTQVDDMVTGDWDLTMFTCTTGGQSRCAVRCVRISDD